MNNQIALTYNEIGMNLFNEKKFEDAIKCFDESLKCNGNQAVLRLNKGDCYMELNDINKALIEYKLGLENDHQGNKELRARIAIVYYKLAIISFNIRDYKVLFTVKILRNV